MQTSGMPVALRRMMLHAGTTSSSMTGTRNGRTSVPLRTSHSRVFALCKTQSRGQVQGQKQNLLPLQLHRALLEHHNRYCLRQRHCRHRRHRHRVVPSFFIVEQLLRHRVGRQPPCSRNRAGSSTSAAVASASAKMLARRRPKFRARRHRDPLAIAVVRAAAADQARPDHRPHRLHCATIETSLLRPAPPTPLPSRLRHQPRSCRSEGNRSAREAHKDLRC